MKLQFERAKNKNLTIYIYLVMVISVIYIFISEMTFYYKMNIPLFIYSKTYVASCIVVFSSLYILLINKCKAIFKLSIFYTIIILNLITIFTTLLNYEIYYGSKYILIVQLFMWCAVFIIAFKGVDNIDYFDKAINRVMLFFPIVLALYLSYAFSDHYKASDQANSIYYCLLFLPFVLAYKRKYLNVIYIAALFACSFISLKRTAIIGLVLSVFIFYVVELYTKDELNKKFAIIVGSILLIIICVGSYNFLADNFNIDIISRFDSISSDEGSGRKYIWEEVWNQQKNAPIKHWILGEGSNGVYYKANIFLLRDYVSAHDDFLEVLYDYGIFGFIFYIAFIIQIIIYAIRMIKKKISIAAPFTASIALFVTMSVTSHLIIYPNYFYLIMIFWGMCIAKYENLYNQKRRSLM